VQLFSAKIFAMLQPTPVAESPGLPYLVALDLNGGTLMSCSVLIGEYSNNNWSSLLVNYAHYFFNVVTTYKTLD